MNRSRFATPINKSLLTILFSSSSLVMKSMDPTNQNQRRRFFFIQNANSDILISVSNASVCAPVPPRLGSASKNPSCLDVHQNKLFVNENAIFATLVRNTKYEMCKSDVLIFWVAIPPKMAHEN